MPKQVAPVEVNRFVGGLVTDASPLTFPDNASIAEDNFVLNIDGSRNRRLGMDKENNFSTISSSVSYSPTLMPSHTSYRWKNAGGDPDKSILAVQFGNEIKFFDLDNETISSQVVHTESFPSSTLTTQYSYAVVDGLLVVATGEKDVNIFEYDSAGPTITKTTDSILIRDFFGVDVEISGENLRQSNKVTKRPTTTTDGHLYNLRNQSWAEARKNANNESLIDPISAFLTTASKYPSNADTVTQSLFADANDADDRIGERFFPADLRDNPIGSSHAPSGHYIIDALARGASREAAYAETVANAEATLVDITSLPQDLTPGGATVVAQFAGRVWYAGFSGEVTNGDGKSPRMSSYILYSQQVEDISDIVLCYQAGDPTAKEEPDLLDTDGGFIRIDEAYGIKNMVNLDNTLFIFAQNGVWRVAGDDNATGFKATANSVIKVSDRGIRGAKSVVVVDGAIVFWGDDGIYQIAKNQFGDWQNTSLTEARIQGLYNDITSEEKELVQGYYDSYDKKARWVYQNKLDDTTDVRELILDKSLGAFYTNTIATSNGAQAYPRVVGIFETNPFRVSTGTEDVEVGIEVVQVNGVDVQISGPVRSSATRQIGYVCVSSVASTVEYTFCNYRDSTFRDWKSVDSVGKDAAAFLITGYLSGGDFQRQKQLSFLTTYMKKTEDGFVLDVNGDLSPANQSSCKVQTQWDWTNSANSNKWSSERQFYRLKRHYFPVDLNDEFEDGHTVVVGKDKIRGRGRVVSIKFATEPDKDLVLYGWSLIVGVMSNV